MTIRNIPLLLLIALFAALASHAEEMGRDERGALPRIAWEPVTGARAYLVEVAQAGLEIIMASETVEEPSYELKLPPGKYRLRVTTLNKNLRKELSTPWIDFTLKQPVYPRITELQPSEIFAGEVWTFLVRGSGLSSETSVFLRNEESGLEIRPSRTIFLSSKEIEISFASPLESGTYTVLAENPPDLAAEHPNGLSVILPPAPEPPPAEALAAVPLLAEQGATEPPSIELPTGEALAAELALAEAHAAAPPPIAPQEEVAAVPAEQISAAPQEEVPVVSPEQPPIRLTSMTLPPVTVGIGYFASFVFGSWNDMLPPSYLGGEAYLIVPLTPVIGATAEIDYVKYESDPGNGMVSGTLRIASTALGLYADLHRPLPLRLRLLGGWGYSMAEADNDISGTGTDDEQSGDFFAQCGASLVLPFLSFLSLEAGCDLRSIFYTDEIMFTLRPVVRLGLRF